MIDQREYEGLARETGAYKDIELDILKEAISAWEKSPGNPYTILEIRDGKVLAGFAVMRREEATDYTFNAQAFCVDPSYLGKGVVDNLLSMLEREARSIAPSAILRFETSTEKEAAFGAGLLSARGYSLIGHIPDFYAAGNDYYMYAKHLHHREPKPEEGAASGEGEKT
jgi:ribosomal protein S18 acetylase RimI-like enzyme